MKRAVAIAVLLALLLTIPAAAIAQPTPRPTDSPEERPKEPTERFVFLAVGLLFVLLVIVGLSYLKTVVRSTGSR